MMGGYNEEPSGFRASQQIQNLYFQPGFLGPLRCALVLLEQQLKITAILPTVSVTN